MLKSTTLTLPLGGGVTSVKAEEALMAAAEVVFVREVTGFTKTNQTSTWPWCGINQINTTSKWREDFLNNSHGVSHAKLLKRPNTTSEPMTSDLKCGPNATNTYFAQLSDGVAVHLHDEDKKKHRPVQLSRKCVFHNCTSLRSFEHLELWNAPSHQLNASWFWDILISNEGETPFKT